MAEIMVWAAPVGGVAKGGVVAGAGTAAVLERLDTETLNANLRELVGSLDQVLADVETRGGWRLKTVDVGLEISAQGGFHLVGTLTVAGKAAIKLTLERG